MKIQLVPTVFATLAGLTIAPFILPAIAHQAQHESMSAEGGMGAMIHLDPNDSPVAGQPSATWFMLTTPAGATVPLANCACQVMVQDRGGEMILSNLPLSETMVDGQAAIATAITFPAPGAYTVVLAGQSQDGSFEPFEIRFPVTSVGSYSAY